MAYWTFWQVGTIEFRNDCTCASVIVFGLNMTWSLMMSPASKPFSIADGDVVADALDDAAGEGGGERGAARDRDGERREPAAAGHRVTATVCADDTPTERFEE